MKGNKSHLPFNVFHKDMELACCPDIRHLEHADLIGFDGEESGKGGEKREEGHEGMRGEEKEREKRKIFVFNF